MCIPLASLDLIDAITFLFYLLLSFLLFILFSTQQQKDPLKFRRDVTLLLNTFHLLLISLVVKSCLHKGHEVCVMTWPLADPLNLISYFFHLCSLCTKLSVLIALFLFLKKSDNFLTFTTASLSVQDTPLAQTVAQCACSLPLSLLSTDNSSARTSLITDIKTPNCSTSCTACSIPLPSYIFINSTNYHMTQPSNQVKNTFNLGVVGCRYLPNTV